MYFDPIRNAYIDSENGAVILVEDHKQDDYQSTHVSDVHVELSKIHEPRIYEKDHYIPARSMSFDGGEIQVGRNHRVRDDWNLASYLQYMEFEMPMDTFDGFDEHADFNAKEVRASKSCRRQLLTLSFFICLVQIGVLIAMIQIDGYAPSNENPVIGPPAYTLVRFGAKQAALIVDRTQYWRLFSSMMLHAGILHILPNVAIQLRVGGYLNLIYGTPKWIFIYIVSGAFGQMMSCLFLPDSVGVGSSGALMGMLASWVVWIIFRWRKIPPECHTQRNCQLVVVFASIIITLATSFTPNVDWAAHLGGAFQGALWGVVLLSSELDIHRTQLRVRIAAFAIAVGCFIYALYYLIVLLKPPQNSLDYWSENDDWGKHNR